MPVVRIDNPISRDITLNSRTRVDWYLLTGVTDIDSDAQAFGAGIPQPGALLPDNSIVSSARLARALNATSPFSALWEVRSEQLFEFPAYRRSSRVGGQGWEWIQLPNWKAYTAATGPSIYVAVAAEDRYRHKRGCFYRIKSKQTTGITDDQVAAFDAQHKGKRVTLGGIVHLYMGTEAFFDAQNFVTVNVNYYTNQVVPAFGIGSKPGYDVALPQLPPLSEYVYTRPDVTTTLPIVTASDPTTDYAACPTIPWA